MINTVLITGANGGIGKALVNQFTKANMQVIAVTHTNSEYNCDISDPESISSLFENLKTKNIIVDCLINNAGIYKAISWEGYTQGDIDAVLGVNLIGSFNMCCHFAKQAPDNSSIINIASIAGIAGGGDPIYSASKAGMIGMTKSLAQSLAPKIRVNAIAPAVVRTPMMDIIPDTVLEKYKQKELLHQDITPESVAEVALFLANAENITGATIDINNGVYLR